MPICYHGNYSFLSSYPSPFTFATTSSSAAIPLHCGQHDSDLLVLLFSPWTFLIFPLNKHLFVFWNESDECLSLIPNQSPFLLFFSFSVSPCVCLCCVLGMRPIATLLLAQTHTNPFFSPAIKQRFQSFMETAAHKCISWSSWAHTHTHTSVSLYLDIEVQVVIQVFFMALRNDMDQHSGEEGQQQHRWAKFITDLSLNKRLIRKLISHPDNKIH